MVIAVDSTVAIVSVVASSAVALAAVAAQIWQGHLNRQSEQRAWLRDRRADTYVSMFRLFEKTPSQVSQDEWEILMATVRVFASRAMTDLYAQWAESGRVTRDDNASQEVRESAYQDAVTAQRQMESQAVSELQGR